MAASEKKEAPRVEWPVELQTLGARMKFARERIPMTKAALSDLSGTDQSTITRLEDGERLAHVSTLIAIAKALGVRIGWLLGNEGALEEPIEPPPGALDQRRRIATKS
jgi:transcriptional regulator with XRE-family HTH domain